VKFQELARLSSPLPETLFAVFYFSLYTSINMTDKVLIVEDDANLLEAIKYNLRKDGYEVVIAGDGEMALEVARREKPDILILDIMLPKLSGFEVCRILRKETTIPILMLTAKADETDKIVGLEIGADDYMTKPFSMRELMARIRAMLRRVKMTEQPITEGATSIKVGNLEVDVARHQASLSGKVLELSPKEFDLLVFLTKNKGLVFNREQLLEKVWGYDFTGDSRTVDVHIRWLRQKIETDASHPQYLVTVRGTGYKLEG
jgi:two-component system, OmpR family, response regulator